MTKTITDEKQAMLVLLDKKGWRNEGINNSIQLDTGIDLIIFTKKENPVFSYVGRGSSYFYETIDIDDEALSWQHWDKEMKALGNGQGLESLRQHLKA